MGTNSDQAIPGDGEKPAREIELDAYRIDVCAVGGAAINGSDGLAMGDLDLDGELDIASVHESDTEYDGVADGHVRLAFGSTDPDRWQLRTVAEGERAAAPEDVVITDLTGDGYPDLVVACELAHVLFLANPGPDARTAPWPHLIIPGTLGRGSFIRVAAGDFDGDGRGEVATANKGAQNPGQERTPAPISWFSIEGDPLDGASWVEHELIRVDWPINVEMVDEFIARDMDGDVDFVSTRGNSAPWDGVFWLEQVRTESAVASFERARELDSVEMPRPMEEPY